MPALPRWLTPALLLIAAAACFSPGLGGGFLFDDFPNLVRDPAWQIRSLSPAELHAALTAGHSGFGGRALAMLSFALNHIATGLDPWWFKLTNLLWHALNGMLVWRLARQLFARVTAGPRPGAFAAALLALAWLVHPLQVSSTLYIVQRMELGAASASLLALLAYLQARQRQQAGQRAWPWLLGACACLLVGLGFKETVALTPGYAFLIELYLLGFRTQGNRAARGWKLAYALMATGAALAAAYLMLPALRYDPETSARIFSPWERLLTQGPVLQMYLQQILLPLPSSLTFHYDNFPVSHGWWAPPATTLAWLLLAALAGLACALRKRWPLTALGIGWFFIGHALTSNVIPLELAFEHRNYLPLFGILLALVQPLCALGKRLHGDARAVLAPLPVLALGALCALHAGTWGNPLKLAWTLENINPTSQRASYGLAEQLIRQAKGDRESPQWSMGMQQMAAAAKLPGPSPLALQGVILLRSQSGQAPDDEAWERLLRHVSDRAINVETTGALHALAACEIEQRCHDFDGRLQYVLAAAMTRNPNDATVRTIAANHAWNTEHDGAKAIMLQREAVALTKAPNLEFALVQFLLASGNEALEAEGRERGKNLLRAGGLPPQDLALLRTRLQAH